MRDKDIRKQLSAWRQRRHRLIALARNPLLAEAAPEVMSRDIKALDKLMRAHIAVIASQLEETTS